MIGVGEVVGAIRHARTPANGRGAEADAKDAKVPAAQQIRTRKRLITARTPAQSAYLSALQAHDLVFATGPAGTGKTYLAVAFAAACLESGKCDRLILSRPAVEAGERLGFLPGDMREKVDPYLRPLYDALYDVLAPERVERGLATGMIEIAPLAFMRGRTLSHAMIILDEAQNCTPMQMKMFLTRLGEGSKMIVTGDPTQVDLPPARIPACSRPSPFSKASRISPISPSPAATWFAASSSARSSTPMRRRPSGVSAMADGGPSSARAGRCLARYRDRAPVGALGPHRDERRCAVARGEGRLRGVFAQRRSEPCEATLVLTDDDEMRELNRIGAARTPPPMCCPSRPESPRRSPWRALPSRRCRARRRDGDARRRSSKGIPVADHAAHLVVHGMLHLLGLRP